MTSVDGLFGGVEEQFLDLLGGEDDASLGDAEYAGRQGRRLQRRCSRYR